MAFPARLVGVLALAGASWSALGCAHVARQSPLPQEALPEKRLKQIVTRAGREVTIRWCGEPGVTYAILFTDNLRDPTSWRILEGYGRIRGAGTEQAASFQAPLPGRVYYRVRIAPLRLR